LGLLSHATHLEAEYGAGPHTISIPRLRPADGSEVASAPPAPVDDDHFKALVAILRIAVPYTGMILSTRESPEMREALLQVGISQMSAGSRTDVGGECENKGWAAPRFFPALPLLTSSSRQPLLPPPHPPLPPHKHPSTIQNSLPPRRRRHQAHRRSPGRRHGRRRTILLDGPPPRLRDRQRPHEKGIRAQLVHGVLP
jgi:hypothetical protein